MKFRAILNDEYDREYTEKRGFELKPRHKTIIFFLIIAAVVNLLAVIYIKRGSFIYFWDNATYWDIARKIASGGISEGGFWNNVYRSIGTEDYNYIAGLPSALVAALFGESRLAYVLGLVNMYLIPSYIIIYLLAKKISKAPKIALVLVIFLCPAIMFMAFIGFADIGGLIITLLCFYLYYSCDGKGIWRYIIIGALLVLAMLWRRWYAFFAVSFITAMAADCLLMRRRWHNTLITAAVAAATLLLFFRDFVTNKLVTDYGSLYAGYKFSLMTDFKLTARYFGLIFIGVLAVCSVVMRVKRGEARTIFMWIQTTVCAAMFLATQTHGQQHLLLYLPSLIVLTLITVKHITKEWALLALAALALVNSVNVYLPRSQPTNIQDIKGVSLFTSFSMLPLRRDDAGQILELKQKLDETVYEGDTLGVLASSFTINEDILKNVEPSLGIKGTRKNYIVSLPQVDSRDFDLSALYNVNFILAVFPAQTHLAQGSQSVLEEAVKSFENYADIATAYIEAPECETVINDMRIKLFRRIRDEEAEDIREFESRLGK